MLGLIFGATFDFFSMFLAMFSNKIVKAVFDFLMMLLWAVLYFCVMLGYNDGEYRYYHSVVTLLAFILYMITVHKVMGRVFHGIGGKINTSVKRISKKLKLSKKSLKNLLHFSR